MDVTQRGYIKIAVLRGRNAREYHSEFAEAVEAFCSELQNKLKNCILCCALKVKKINMWLRAPKGATLVN